MAVIALSCGGRIQTETIPRQWGIGGRPTWYADKTIGLWAPVAILAVIAPALFLTIKQTSDQACPGDWIGMIAAFVVVLAVSTWHVSAVLAWAAAQR
ncbi:hypothetical protein [Methylobacterium sp. Leaf118]|uniref:hypothetical protein n=1 Tax=Methylobacterium sp. Leaf118 TaxID=2876562 RepID=UPI001E3F7855|nr:hypothetical protein [Methylobacterium sp. Leaf118]